MNTLLTLLLFILIPASLIGQNLIPNSSFENFSDCPEFFGEFESLEYWEATRGSSDLFNNCTSSNYVGWNNSLGFQTPRNGNGYAGIITYSKNIPNEREHFSIELENALELGQTYVLTFYSSLAQNSDDGGSRFASNKLGCLFMTENYLTNEPQGELLNFSHYQAEEILTDTSNWTEHQLEFVADSAYTTISIGNFYDDDNIEVFNFFPEEDSGVAYYYIDDVCLRQESDTCDLVSHVSQRKWSEHDRILIWPNPSNGLFTVQSKSPIERINVFDTSGKLVLQSPVDSINRLELDFTRILNSGVYFLIADTSKGQVRELIVLK